MDLIKIAEEAFATKKELPSFKRVLKMKVRCTHEPSKPQLHT